jgi:small subunit ribosomal protein MRP21
MKDTDSNEVNTLMQNVFASNRMASYYQSGSNSARPNPANISSADLFRASLSKVQTNRTFKDGQGEIDRLLNFGDEFGGNVNKTELLRRSFENVTKAPPLPPPIRLDAYVGRNEETDQQKGIDLGRALHNLEAKCRYNNVRNDIMKQRFHMRPGLKRKTLKSERWRKRFKEGFKAVVSKVQDMRK